MNNMIELQDRGNILPMIKRNGHEKQTSADKKVDQNDHWMGFTQMSADKIIRQANPKDGGRYTEWWYGHIPDDDME